MPIAYAALKYIYIDEQQRAYWDVSSMYLQGTEEYEMHLGTIKSKACQEYDFIWSGKAEGTAEVDFLPFGLLRKDLSARNAVDLVWMFAILLWKLQCRKGRKGWSA